MKFLELSIFLFLAFVPSIYGVIPGGITSIPVDDPEVVRLSQVALLKLNEPLPGGKQGTPKSLVEIVEASRQIVSGTLTRLTLKVTEGEVNKLCKVKIWEQPWLDKTEVTLEDCSDFTEGRRRREAELSEGKQHLTLRLFNDFVKKHNKVYKNYEEFQKRHRIFRANLKKIKLLRENEQGTAQYGLTWFSDLSAKEFKQYLGLKVPEKTVELPPAEIPEVKLPTDFDWRHYNVVTPVKNQEMCGSCWAFSVTGNVEGQWALRRGELLSLSEQELVDCDTSDDGCEGGYMTNAYKAIMKLGGLETENDYPYEATDEQCHFDRSEVRVQISGAVNISSNETKIAQWIFKNGPASVALNANAMQFYFGGVSHPISFLCNPQNLDHGVLIVGFGVHHSSILKRTLPYWLIKNSWGPRWGERGYYKLYRGDGSCGINQMVSSAIVN